MADPRGIAINISSRRPVYTDDPEYDKLLLALHAEQPDALQADELAHVQTLLPATFRSQNDPAADRARLGVPDYVQSMGTFLDADTDAPNGPVADTRSEMMRQQAVRDRMAQVGQTSSLQRRIAEIDPSAADARMSAGPAPAASTARMSARPGAGSMGEFLMNTATMPHAGLIRALKVAGLMEDPRGTLADQDALDALQRTPRRMLGGVAASMGAPTESMPARLLRESLGHMSGVGSGQETADTSGSMITDVLLDPINYLDLAKPVLAAGLPMLGKAVKLAEEAKVARALTGGFYSRVDEAAKMLPAKGVKAESLINTLKKASGGVSAEELDLRGLAEFAASKRGQVITPADLAEHLKANPAPFPTVKTLREEKDNVIQWLERNPYFHGGIPQSPDEWLEVSSRLEAQAQKLQRQGRNTESTRLFDLAGDAERHAEGVSTITGSTYGQPKFSQYVVPGGENYRETLLTLPKRAVDTTGWATKEYRPGAWTVSDANGRDLGNFPEASPEAAIARAAHFEANAPERQQGLEFRSSHFDDPNIVAHTRSNERILPTGERGTFLEEVQSDWHQAGKQRGYFTSESQAPDTSGWTVVSLLDQGGAGGWRVMDANGESLGRVLPGTPANGGARNAEEAIAHVAGNQNTLTRNMAVPDAPFKENWEDLSLKQALIDEANRAPDEPSFLGFTGGKTQADRYNLGKQIDSIDVRKLDTGKLVVYAIKDNERVFQKITDMDGLADVIGKELAEKVKLDASRHTNVGQGAFNKQYSGLDLELGGEGMREFYDRLLPKRLEKIVKPLGGTVESGAISHRQAVPSRPDDLEYMRGFANSGGLTTQQTPMWLSRLTPEMKARILKEGLPLMGLSGLTLGNLLGDQTQETR